MALLNWTDYPRFWLAALPPANEHYDMVILANDDDKLYRSDGFAWVPYSPQAAGGLVPPTAYLDEGVQLVSGATSLNVVGTNLELTAAGNALTLTAAGPAIQAAGTPLVPTPTSINFTGSGVSASASGNDVTVSIPGNPISASDEGSLLSSNIQSLNFTGAGITASAVGAAITVAVPTIPPALAVSDEGVQQTASASSLNFVGGAVSASAVGGAVTVTINDTTVLGSAPPAIAATSSAGSATSVSRSDHTHAGVTSVNGSQGAVTVTVPSPSSATPAQVAGTGAIGSSPDYARADHVHAHGNLSGGSLHSSATSGSAGFMPAADKAKLDNYVPGKLHVGTSAPSSPAANDLWVDTSTLGELELWTYLKLSSDFSTTNSSGVTVTGMEFAVQPSTTYIVEGFCSVKSASTTTGVGLGLAWPTGVASGSAAVEVFSSVSTKASATEDFSAAFYTTATSVDAANKSRAASVAATFTTGSSPSGNLSLKLKRNSGTDVVTVVAGSWLRYRTI